MNSVILIMNLAPGEIFAFLLSLGFCVLIFLALRGLFLWYWKVNVMIENQQKQIDLLRKLVDNKAGSSISVPSEVAEKARKYDEMTRRTQP